MGKPNNSLTTLALQKFKKNFWGVFSLGIIFCIGLISVFAYLFAPDATKNANQMHLAIHSKSPGFNVEMLTIPSGIELDQNFLSQLFFGKQNTDTEIPVQSYSVNNGVLSYVEYASDGLKGVEKEVELTKFSDSDYKDFIENRTFLFGTDKYGRDYLSRILIGSRISFFIGFIAKRFQFSIEDRITAQFCGTKKSLVHGTVFSKILFQNASFLGIILLPIMMFHAFQIVAISVIAAKYGRRD